LFFLRAAVSVFLRQASWICRRSAGVSAYQGFKKKDISGTYDARIALSSEFKVRMEFEQSSTPSSGF